jgi:uncharacterized repeat protein (TIGR01451 family)
VTAGNNITYTITVANNGPSDAQDVSVNDPLPAGTSFGSATPSQGTCDATVSCALGTINSGASVTIALVVDVDPAVAGVITNTATASSTTADPDPGNNVGTAATTVAAPPSADVAVTKTDSPDPVTAGNNITYTITVTNNGPSDAPSVTLADEVPTGTSFVSASSSQGACAGTTTITCPLSLGNGASATVTLVVKVDPSTPAGTITNTAEALSRTADPELGNNTATATTPVVEGPPPVSADLSVTKTDSPDPVTAGSNLTYTITVTNNGPADADSAQVTDAVPAGTSFVSVTPSQGSCDGTTDVLCTLGPLANGASATVTLVVLVDPAVSPGAVISNTALLNPRVVRPPGAEPVPPEGLPPVGLADPAPRPGGGVIDPNPNNDSATATTTVAVRATEPLPGLPSEPGNPNEPAAPAMAAAASPAASAATAAKPVIGRPTFTG